MVKMLNRLRRASCFRKVRGCRRRVTKRVKWERESWFIRGVGGSAERRVFLVMSAVCELPLNAGSPDPVTKSNFYPFARKAKRLVLLFFVRWVLRPWSLVSGLRSSVIQSPRKRIVKKKPTPTPQKTRSHTVVPRFLSRSP